jgi:hypothetical protein
MTTAHEGSPLIDKLDELRTDIIDMRFQEMTEARLLGLIDSAESLSRQVLAAKDATIAELIEANTACALHIASQNERIREDESTWLAIVRDIANLGEAINPDDAMGQADDSDLQAHFDPWQTLREARSKIAERDAKLDIQAEIIGRQAVEMTKAQWQIAELTTQLAEARIDAQMWHDMAMSGWMEDDDE